MIERSLPVIRLGRYPKLFRADIPETVFGIGTAVGVAQNLKPLL
jgi:hypothetical protein